MENPEKINALNRGNREQIALKDRLSGDPLSSRPALSDRERVTLRVGQLLFVLAIVVGLITRLVAVFQYVTFDIGPDPDQIRDAFAVMDIWQGSFPTLGPRVTTIGNHHILPLYYYLFFPFTILGASPTFQALPNAVFSFLSIPLFVVLLYQLLEGVETSKKVFLSSLGGFWYSVLFGDIFISNFQWNPSPIPFFAMVLTLLYRLQMQRSFSFLHQTLLWAAYGVVFAFCISLHSSTLFVMPAVFIVTSSLFIFEALRKQRQPLLLVLPGISVLASVITLLPYWVGEAGRGFRNTKEIIKTISSSGQSTDGNMLTGLYAKVSGLLLNYFVFPQQAYFWNSSGLYLGISIVFLFLVTWLGVSKFKGNRAIGLMWCLTWGLLLLAASNINPRETPYFYKSLILFAPIALSISAIAYLDWAPAKKRIFSGFLGFVIFLSIFSNLSQDYQFLRSKYGPDRLMSTGDVVRLINQLPAGSTLCDPRIEHKREIQNQYNYINTFVTQREITITAACQAGSFVIHPKRIMLIEGNLLNTGDYERTYFFEPVPDPSINLFPIFEIGKNGPIERSSTLFTEIDTAYVYRLT